PIPTSTLFPYTTLFRSTPQLLQAAYSNEVLKTVTIDFVKRGMDGKPVIFQTITLSNAFVLKVNQFGGTSATEKSLSGNNVLEEIDRKSTRLNSSHSQIS